MHWPLQKAQFWISTSNIFQSLNISGEDLQRGRREFNMVYFI